MSPPLIDIGFTDLPKSGGSPAPTGLQSWLTTDNSIEVLIMGSHCKAGYKVASSDVVIASILHGPALPWLLLLYYIVAT